MLKSWRIDNNQDSWYRTSLFIILSYCILYTPSLYIQSSDTTLRILDKQHSARCKRNIDYVQVVQLVSPNTEGLDPARNISFMRKIWITISLSHRFTLSFFPFLISIYDISCSNFGYNLLSCPFFIANGNASVSIFRI